MGPHFIAMITIEWKYTYTNNWHAQLGAYMLKKTVMGERTLFKLYKNDTLLLSTFREQEFMCEVRDTVKPKEYAIGQLVKKMV